MDAFIISGLELNHHVYRVAFGPLLAAQYPDLG